MSIFQNLRSFLFDFSASDKERQDTGDEFTLPADMSALTIAAEGEYRLKPSGDVVVDPDYLAVWTIQKPGASAEEAQSHGVEA